MDVVCSSRLLWHQICQAHFRRVVPDSEDTSLLNLLHVHSITTYETLCTILSHIDAHHASGSEWVRREVSFGELTLSSPPMSEGQL